MSDCQVTVLDSWHHCFVWGFCSESNGSAIQNEGQLFSVPNQLPSCQVWRKCWEFCDFGGSWIVLEEVSNVSITTIRYISLLFPPVMEVENDHRFVDVFFSLIRACIQLVRSFQGVGSSVVHSCMCSSFNHELMNGFVHSFSHIFLSITSILFVLSIYLSYLSE